MVEVKSNCDDDELMMMVIMMFRSLLAERLDSLVIFRSVGVAVVN